MADKNKVVAVRLSSHQLAYITQLMEAKKLPTHSAVLQYLINVSMILK
jgi:hypothetical protein